MEFLFAIGIILVLFLTTLAFSYSRHTDLKELKDHLKINDECQRLANVISSLNIAGPGSKFNTKINHDLTIFDNGEITIEPVNISCFYIANMEKNTKLTANQYIKIENNESIITIENV